MEFRSHTTLSSSLGLPGRVGTEGKPPVVPVQGLDSDPTSLTWSVITVEVLGWVEVDGPETLSLSTRDRIEVVVNHSPGND